MNVRALTMGLEAPPPPDRTTAPEDAALRKVAEELEAAFLRHLLEASKIGGEEMESGYGAMVVDALASGIQAGMWKMLKFAGWSLQYLAQWTNGLVTE